MSDQLALKCPNCASPIAQAGIDPLEGIARCSYCRALTTLPPFMRKERARARPRMPMPPGVSLENTPGGVTITRRWLTTDFQSLLAAVIAWAVFLGWLNFGMAGHSGLMESQPIVFAVVAMAAGYVAVALVINRTWIRAGNGVLTLLHGPLPWPGNQVLACAEVEQLFCKEKVHHGKDGPRLTFEVWAALQGGLTRKVLRSVPDDEHAIFFEQQIEAALGIEDRPMPGELYRL